MSKKTGNKRHQESGRGQDFLPSKVQHLDAVSPFESKISDRKKVRAQTSATDVTYSSETDDKFVEPGVGPSTISSTTSTSPSTVCKVSHIHLVSANTSQDEKPKDKVAPPRLDRAFFDISADDLAKALLGKRIVRLVDGVRLCATIVETEAYLGAIDKAAHSFKGQTDRNKAMFMQPGTAYVYNIYGMYCCLNISSQGEGCAVLIRSVEPVEGLQKMMTLRKGKMKSSSAMKAVKVRELGNGPAKLCQSLAITKENVNQCDMVHDSEIWLEAAEPIRNSDVVVSARINIGYAEEWKSKPLRFYVLDNPCVSVRDKNAEKEIQTRNPTVSCVAKH